MKKQASLITSIKLDDNELRTILYWVENVWREKNYLLEEDKKVLQKLLSEAVDRDLLRKEGLETVRRMLLS